MKDWRVIWGQIPRQINCRPEIQIPGRESKCPIPIDLRFATPAHATHPGWELDAQSIRWAPVPKFGAPAWRIRHSTPIREEKSKGKRKIPRFELIQETVASVSHPVATAQPNRRHDDQMAWLKQLGDEGWELEQKNGWRKLTQPLLDSTVQPPAHRPRQHILGSAAGGVAP